MIYCCCFVLLIDLNYMVYFCIAWSDDQLNETTEYC